MAEKPIGRSRALEHLNTEMDRLYDIFGLGRDWLGPRPGMFRPRTRPGGLWIPDIEMVQRNRDLVIRADLPGLTKDDVEVESSDDALTIRGERKWEREDEHEGVYRSERAYGSFYRVIPLPEGTVAEQAKATFKNGVLEITMPGPPLSATEGRPIPITEPT
jgi:HSP20 family protein